MLYICFFLCAAAVLGVMVATTTTCVIGLIWGTKTWCGLPFFWFLGFPIAITGSLIFGLPATFVFRKLGFKRWWQFCIGALLLTIPFWFELAEPFESIRWKQSGGFDSLNYLGTGVFTGLFYWWILFKLKPYVKDKESE